MLFGNTHCIGSRYVYYQPIYFAYEIGIYVFRRYTNKYLCFLTMHTAYEISTYVFRQYIFPKKQILSQ